MTLHHYLPAAFLARFSADIKTEPARNRKLMVGEKQKQRCFQAPASKVGCVNNLYTLIDNSTDPNEIDRTWTLYEKNLPIAINNLIQKNIDAELWMRVMVPFVACMLVRGPDFNERFGLRFSSDLRKNLTEVQFSDNLNYSRLVELQRLLGSVTTAKWKIYFTRGSTGLITNDLGYSSFFNPINGDLGIGIPLDRKTILAIIPTTKDRPILLNQNNKWIPVIDYAELPLDGHNEFNNIMAQTAQKFIFGSDEKVIEKYIRENPLPSSLNEPHIGFQTREFSIAYEFTWHRLVGSINKLPSETKSWDFGLDWKSITSGWHSRPIFPTNLIEFPSPLKRIGNAIWIKFYDPEVYFAISEILSLEETKLYDLAISTATKALTLKITLSTKSKILEIRGRILLEMGRNNEAIKDFKQAMLHNDSSTDLLANFGYALLQVGNTSQAHKILSKAIKLNPGHGIAYLNRGIVEWRIGRLKKAIEDSSMAIKLIPDDMDKAKALWNRGTIYKELGLDNEAKRDFKKAEILFKKQKQENSK